MDLHPSVRCNRGVPAPDIVRLHLKDGNRHAAQIEAPTTKAERVAARHLSVQLLPAASAGVVAIVEGPHDRAALDAVAAQLRRTAKKPLPAAHGIAIIDAGIVDGSGGAAAVARLASLAAGLGFTPSVSSTATPVTTATRTSPALQPKRTVSSGFPTAQRWNVPSSTDSATVL